MENRIASSLKTKRWTMLMSLVVLLVLAFTSATATADSTSAQGDMVVNHNPADVQAAWQSWRNNYVTRNGAGPAPNVRVLGGVNNQTTVSEGQSYAMLFASLFDDQATFDGAWLFAKAHLTQHGLMHWYIQRYGQILGTGAATDADLDMAIALVTACKKVENGEWSPSQHGINYCTDATNVINAIWNSEIDKAGNQPAGGLNNNQGFELIPGDSWNLQNEYRNGIVNLSYFSPAYFRVFAEFTGRNGWYNVIDRNYAIADLSQALGCSMLVPNWSQYNGQVQVVSWHGASSAHWGWDAARFAWRVATDRYWFDDPKARETMNEIGGFFASVGINNVRAEYRLNGTAVNSYTHAYFTSTAASAIWAAPNPTPTNCGQASGSIRSNPQQAYNATVNTISPNYYGDSWRLFAMTLMTGHFPNPLDGGANPQPHPTEPTPEPTEVTPQPTEPTEEPNGAPTINPVPAQTNMVGDAVNLQITASDPDGDPLRFDAGNTLPSGLSMNLSNGMITGTLNNAGQYDVRIRVIDPSGAQANMSFNWTVNAQPGNDPALTNGMSVSLRGNNNKDDNQQTAFRVRIENNTGQAQSGLSFRIYFTADNGQSGSAYTMDIRWDQAGAASVSGPTQFSGDVYFFTVSYGNATLQNGRAWQFQGALHAVDWSRNWNSDNDWWKTGGLNSEYVATTYIPVYRNGALVAGTEPNGNPSQPTPTEPPVTTPEPTEPPATPTTPVPTEPPATPEPTEPPATQSNLSVQVRGTGTQNNQQVGFQYKLVNNGSSPQSNVSVRFYFTVDNGETAQNYVLQKYWDQSGSATVSNATQANGNVYYFTVTHNGTLQPGASWEFHTAMHLVNWAQTFDASNDWWVGGGLSNSFANTNRVPVYVNGSLVAGQAP